MSVDVIEYRNGNDKENGPRKLTGLQKVADVTLKRGIIGSLEPLPVARPDPQRRPARSARS